MKTITKALLIVLFTTLLSFVILFVAQYTINDIEEKNYKARQREETNIIIGEASIIIYLTQTKQLNSYIYEWQRVAQIQDSLKAKLY